MQNKDSEAYIESYPNAQDSVRETHEKFKDNFAKVSQQAKHEISKVLDLCQF